MTSDFPITSRPLQLQLHPRFLKAQECREFIQRFEDSKWEALSTRQRLEFDDELLAENLFQLWLPHKSFETMVDECGDEWTIDGLNTHFRLCRYLKGDKFDRHEDGFFWGSWNRKSFTTFMLYLNDVPVEHGGATDFYEHGTVIQPREGSLIVFPVEDMMHKGHELKQGRKYILRSDVMYRCTKCKDVQALGQVYQAYEKARLSDTWDDFFEGYESYRDLPCQD